MNNQQWVVTKYDDFGEPLLRELQSVPIVPLSYDQLLGEVGEAIV